MEEQWTSSSSPTRGITLSLPFQYEVLFSLYIICSFFYRFLLEYVKIDLEQEKRLMLTMFASNAVWLFA